MKVERFSKRNGNEIETKKFIDGKLVSCGWKILSDIDLEKSYIDELYCRSICGNCYAFGCDWDIRCNENREPIQNVVSDCPKFKNGFKIAKALTNKMKSDKDFYDFLKICNKNKNKLETFLAIYKKYLDGRLKLE